MAGRAKSTSYSEDITLNAAFLKLAAQLVALRTEYSYDIQFHSGEVTPVEGNSFFGSSANMYQNGGSIENNNYWTRNETIDRISQEAGYYDYGNTRSLFGDDAFERATDTPNTWPQAEGGQDPYRASFDSGARFTAFYNGESKDSGIGMPYPMSPQDVQEWLRDLQPPTPGPGYVCRICERTDHYVQNCPRAPPAKFMKTPYQGHNQCFGLFYCRPCNREWYSHNSFAQRPDFCHSCKSAVFPYKQFPLDKIPPNKIMMMKQRGKRRRLSK